MCVQVCYTIPVFSCSLKNSDTFVGDFLVVLEEVPKFDTFNAVGTSALDTFSLKSPISFLETSYFHPRNKKESSFFDVVISGALDSLFMQSRGQKEMLSILADQ